MTTGGDQPGSLDTLTPTLSRGEREEMRGGDAAQAAFVFAVALSAYQAVRNALSSRRPAG